MGATGSVLRFALLLSKGPTAPKAKRPNANPSPSPSSSPLPADKLGGSGVGGRASGQVWRGSSRLWGKHTGTVKTPTLRVEQSQPSQHPTPPPGKEHTHVKPTYLLRFSSPPRGCRHLCIPSNSSLVAETCILLLLLKPASQPLTVLPLDHSIRVMAKAQQKGT